MDLLTEQIRERLMANGNLRRQTEDFAQGHLDFVPVVKLFTPYANATRLITEADPDDPDRLFGLCDLGLGTPELGYVSLSELRALRGPFGLSVERDLYFEPMRTISAYTAEARVHGYIKT